MERSTLIPRGDDPVRGQRCGERTADDEAEMSGTGTRDKTWIGTGNKRVDDSRGVFAVFGERPAENVANTGGVHPGGNGALVELVEECPRMRGGSGESCCAITHNQTVERPAESHVPETLRSYDFLQTGDLRQQGVPMKRSASRRRVRTAGAVLTAAVLAVGCSSGSSGSSDEFSLDTPTSIGESPSVIAGVAFPEDSVNRAVAKLDDLAEQVMSNSGIPGMAIAVVHGGKVLYAKGFGVRDIEKGDKVDADTVFQVASVSKSVSATVVASEVTKGDVSWDSKVKELMPNFSLADPWVSDNVTVGDGFSHRTGLPGAAGDKLEDLGFDRQYILDHLRMHQLNPFRITYNYANYGLTMGAEAVATKAGKEWADLAEEAIYKPLGLDSTSSRHSDFLTRSNRATLHQKVDGRFVHDLDRDADPQSPAGGVSSSVNDLAKWLLMVLGNGTYEGKQIYSPESFLPAISPQVVSHPPSTPESRASFYGYGYNVNTSAAGRTGFNHSGAFLSGAATNILALPSADVAIVTLTNAWPIGVPEIVNESFSDLVQFGSITEDFTALFTKVLGPITVPDGSLVGKSAPTNPAPAKPLSEYAGTYANDYYGPATISEKDGALVLGLGPAGQTFPLKHWDGDTFTFTLLTENAAPGTISKATFDGGRLNLEYYDAEKMGTFVR